MNKFRSWNTRSKKMRPVDTLYFENGEIAFVEVLTDEASDWDGKPKGYAKFSVENKYNVLMQSTGMKDLNGLGIYEGDIVIIGDYFNGEIKSKVVFENGSFGFVGIGKSISEVVSKNWNDDFLTMAYLSWLYDSLENYLSNVIVIGNIYENQELLEVAE